MEDQEGQGIGTNTEKDLPCLAAIVIAILDRFSYFFWEEATNFPPQVTIFYSNLINTNMFITECFKKLWHIAIDWLTYNVKFTKAGFFISGFILSHSFVEEGLLDVLMTHLREIRGLALPRAAQIVNLQEGLSSVLMIFVACISDTYLGHFRMTVLSTIAFIIGLAVLCIGAWVSQNIQLSLTFGILILLCFGQSGRDCALKSFLADQFRSRTDRTLRDIEEQAESRAKFWWRFWRFPGIIVAVSAFSNYSHWKLLTLASATAISVGFAIFLSGVRFYSYRRPPGGSLCTVFHVLKAAILKCRLRYPNSSSQYYKNESSQTLLYPSIPLLRWLDKAAIIESSSVCPEEQVQKGKLCTVADVKEVKLLFTMIPMWMTFLVYSLVEATGSTFFFEQSNAINGDFPVNIFLVIKAFTVFMITFSCSFLPSNLWFLIKRRPITIFRIGIGMICSILCCIVAWRLERYRKTTDTMNVLWLVPQFIFLGCMEGFAVEGLYDFTNTQVSSSIRIYGPDIGDLTLGIGRFISIICIKMFENWFGYDLDRSHLDKYYAMLAWLSFANLVIFGCCGYLCGYRLVGAEADEVETEASDESQEQLNSAAEDDEDETVVSGEFQEQNSAAEDDVYGPPEENC